MPPVNSGTFSNYPYIGYYSYIILRAVQTGPHAARPRSLTAT